MDKKKSLVDLIILYGSQTGTAKFASEELERQLIKHDFMVSVSCLDDFNYVNSFSKYKFIVFIVSTTGVYYCLNIKLFFIKLHFTGNGDPPQNMKKFWNFILRKDLELTFLSGLNFGVFGLGDNSYEKFNYIARALFNRLLQLGGKEFIPIGLGNNYK